MHSVVYVAGPFHGTYACSYEQCLEGLPLCCNLTPGADFLQDILLPDETPHDPRQTPEDAWTTRYMTVRNGRRWGDAWFLKNPESPRLDGTVNLSFPKISHDGLRCAPEVLSRVIPFLTVETTPHEVQHDEDGDGFAVVESLKAASDVYAPVGGTVASVNESLEDEPHRINADPYGDGWLCTIEGVDETALETLLTADQYRELLRQEEG